MNVNEDHIIFDNIKRFRLLNEHVNRYDIIDAIKKHEVLKIYYQGDETVNRGYRTIEPHVIGRTTAGNLAVRAWQQAGASDSRPRKWGAKGGWRLFLLDGISQVLPTNKTFVYYPEKHEYNPNGDQQMEEILMQVDYDKDAGFNISGVDSIDDPDVVKQRVSAFDPQSEKFKSFYDDERNKDAIEKETINNLFDMVKQSYKKNPANYIVIAQNGRYFVTNKSNEPKFDENDVLGNLLDLTREINGTQQPEEEKFDSSFIDNERRDFKTNAEKRQKEINPTV